MKRLAFLAVAIALALSTHAVSAQAAQEHTGVRLLEECQMALRDDDYIIEHGALIKATSCLLYIRGVADTLSLWKDESDVAKAHLLPPACIPDGASNFEMANVVLKYLNDHPNKLHESYSLLVILALQDGYPCQH